MNSTSKNSNHSNDATVVDASSAIDGDSGQYLRDRVHLLHLFPEEVWFMIIDKIDTDDAVLEKLCSSSTFLRELLLERRVDFLFPSVWQILVNCDYYTCLPEAHSELAWNGRLNEVLKLRLVCHSWSKAIDEFYQQHEDHFSLTQHCRPSVETVVDMGQVYIAEYERDPVGEFHYLFDTTYLATGRNPFFGRSVSFHTSDNDSRNHTEKSQKILNLYGRHIWHCHLCIWDTFPSAVDCYLRIREVLEQLPNLKMLHITFFDDSDERTSAELQDLQSEIVRTLLPTFTELEMLSTDSTILSIFHELLRGNSHISRLAIYDNNIHADYNISTVFLPNLKVLSIHFKSEFNFLQTMDHRFHWPWLTELHLHLNYTATAAHWQMIFNVIQNVCKNSLAKLNLTLPRVVAKKEGKQLLTTTYKLNLPHLTNLKLCMPNLTCLDFLLPMVNTLMYLHVDVKLVKQDERVDEQIEKVERGKVIKLLGCEKSKLNTNIYTVFPKLKSLHFHLSTQTE